jgi:tetratricopeptide (TPR) repeat protein
MTPHSRHRRAGHLGAVVLAAGCLCAPAAEQPLNPKDALAPIYRENPKQDDPLADRIRLRNEGIAHYEGGLTLDRGITAFQTAYEAAHQPVDAFNLALIFMKQNKVADARAWSAKALDGNPDFVPAIYLLGLIDKLEGDAIAAKARWSRVNELSPTDPQLHYELAMLANAGKDQRTFLQELLRALELDPQHKSSLYQMYRYYQISGNREMAAATLKRFNALKAAERFSRKERPFDESGFTRPLHDDQPSGSGGFPYIESNVAFVVERPQTGCPLTRLARITAVAPTHEDLLGTCTDNRVVRVAAGTVTGLGTLDAPVDDIRVDWLDEMGPRLIAAGPTGIRLLLTG